MVVQIVKMMPVLTIMRMGVGDLQIVSIWINCKICRGNKD